MKPKVLLLICMLMISYFGAAQYTITYSNHAPQAGDILYLSTMAEYPDINPGNAGENQTWDFSSYPASEFHQYYFDAPENTLWAGQVGDCNIAMVAESKDQSVMYYEVSNDDMRLKYVGTDYSGYQMLSEYWNDYLEMVYPFGYEDSFTDDIAYSIDYSPMGYDWVDSTWTEITVLADGWGTLITPDQTYNNVLRVKYTGSETWKSYVEGVLFNTGSWSETTYHWYCIDSKHSVVRVSILDDEVDPVTTIQYGSSQVGIADIDPQSLIISPNPAHSSFTLQNIPAGINYCYLYSLDGQLVAGYNVNEIQNSTLSCDNMETGLYFIVLSDPKNGFMPAGKLIVQH